MQGNQIVHRSIKKVIARDIASPYSSSIKQRKSSKLGQFVNTSMIGPSNSFYQPDTNAPRIRLRSRVNRSIEITETCTNLEKSKHFTLKLARLLSGQSEKDTAFQIYSAVYGELADYLSDFKDLMIILRKGLVISGIKEKDLDNFEFRKDLENIASDLHVIYNQERKEKSALINKLNHLSEEYIKIKTSYESMQKKYIEYKDIIHGSPSKYIDAKGLLDKMNKQCEIISKQKNIIQDLQHSDKILRTLIGRFESKGFNLEDVLKRQSVVLGLGKDRGKG